MGNFSDLVTVVEWATVLVTFIMMASGLPVCMTMCRTRNVANVPYLLFLISAFVSILGLHYGMLITNKALILINAVSVFVWGVYVAIYILVSSSKFTPMLKLFAVLGMYSAHHYYLTVVPECDVVPTLGNYLLIWCTILCLIPAEEIYTMVQQKSANSCDLSLFFGSTLSAFVWFLYGYLIDDANIYFPNVPALAISAAKSILMFLYGLPSRLPSHQATN